MATVTRSDFKHMKRVLIKAGTSVVTHANGEAALSRIAFIVEQITRLIRSGASVVLVSSGAVGLGKQKLGHHLNKEYEKNHILMRSFAATGQGNLMGIYEYMFSYYKVKCAQVLLTDNDLRISERKANLTNTLNTLLSYNVVPILNENDVISVRTEPYRDPDLKILWDNDSLACSVATELMIDLVVLLTDVDGLYKKSPKQYHKYGQEPEIINLYSESLKNSNGFTIGQKSRVGRGGMQAKITNALSAVQKGVKAVVIASGKKKDSIDKIIAGDTIGTLFVNEVNTYNNIDTIINNKKTELNSSDIAINARNQSRKLVQLSTKERRDILINIANDLDKNRNIILNANKLDIQNGTKTNLKKTLLSRLKLNDDKLNVVIDGIKKIASYQEPIGKIIREHELSDNLNLKQITTPIGVLLVIFESRPDVLPQVIALSIKSGNGLLLKGGKEAYNSNKVLYDIIIASIIRTTGGKIDKYIVNLIETRKDIISLISLDKDKIDLIIPRGSASFVEYIEKNTKIPVLGHSAGLCHLYIDKYANLNKSLKILIDSKTNYPSACNSIETLLIHSEFKYIRELRDILIENDVNIFVGPNAKTNILFNDFPNIKSFYNEYCDLNISIEIVNNIHDAINHINKYSSHHTDSIITENNSNKLLFLNSIDSSCVFHNASTRFADGYRFGLGAEVGISTNRIHARGPVGIDGLLTTKWILQSNNYDIVGDYMNGNKTFTHKIIKSKI